MSNSRRSLFAISGCVQGVGFRPFVFRLAMRYHLVGHICNTKEGVSIDVQGTGEALDAFQKDLLGNKPERAHISEMKREDLPLGTAEQFAIVPSQSGAATTLPFLPDTALCTTCLKELWDRNNRRYRYPFLHCMDCGPRFSVLMRVPFDRDHTTMADFQMCSQCLSEYHNPSDRRFHSQTNCCPQCGPSLQLLDANKEPSAVEPIAHAITLLKAGKILAMKNTGGFLLLADATCEESIDRLRHRKQRPKQPFALLMPTLRHAQEVALIDDIEEQLLTSGAAPIVLLKKREALSTKIAFDSPYYGIMLPHTPLQHLLLHGVGRPLIATSGNLSGMPLCIDEESAFKQLSLIADAFLVHNRRIVHRLDDSIVQTIAGSAMLIRRARGYIPYAIEMPARDSHAHAVFGAGGHLKNSFACSVGQKIYLSQHMGDLTFQESSCAYAQEVERWQTLLNVTFDQGVGDLHPDYSSSRYLLEQNLSTYSIQHHRAHVYAGMVDNRLSFPVFSICWDGTGLGEDQTIWGGEAFLATQQGLRHFATLAPFHLPGGESAIKEPRRTLLGLLHACHRAAIPQLTTFTPEELQILCRALDQKINAPLCSSMGRLFDAISALLGCCVKSHYEGEAALSLEGLAATAVPQDLSYHFQLKSVEPQFWRIEWEGLIQQMLKDKDAGIDLAQIAWGFHHALAQLIVELAERASCEKVLLTGGCMQNKLLSEMAIAQLRQAGFQPFWHHEIPPNDGGLAIGQIVGFYTDFASDRPLMSLKGANNLSFGFLP